MARIELTFERLEHDVSDYGSDEETVGARAFFSTKRDGVLEGSFHADLSYPADDDVKTAEIAVDKPEGDRRPVPQDAFEEDAAAWARALIAAGNLGGKKREPRSLLRRHAVMLQTND